jgi:hypothetical protein
MLPGSKKIGGGLLLVGILLSLVGAILGGFWLVGAVVGCLLIFFGGVILAKGVLDL